MISKPFVDDLKVVLMTCLWPSNLRGQLIFSVDKLSAAHLLGEATLAILVFYIEYLDDTYNM